MNIELKPCPFCGGEAEALSWTAWSPTIYGVTSVACTECAAGIEVDAAELWLHDAAWYWNSRAERTCKPANVAEYAWDDFECSECGWVTWSFLMEHEGCGTVCKPRFCPNCGAKVVEQ